MMPCKLETITLQGIVYFEGRRVIIVKGKCAIYGLVLTSFRHLEDSGYFRKLSAAGGNDRKALLGSNSEICLNNHSHCRSSDLEISPANCICMQCLLVTILN